MFDSINYLIQGNISIPILISVHFLQFGIYHPVIIKPVIFSIRILNATSNFFGIDYCVIMEGITICISHPLHVTRAMQ
jgi:hypothetical protein